MDLFPSFTLLPVWDLKVRRPFAEWDVVALFNWSDNAAAISFDFSEIGLPVADYAIYEFWSQTYQGVHKGRFEMQVPARGVRLLSVHRALPTPQFLSSDRHITQGAVELNQLAWDASCKTLTGRVMAVGGFPLTLRFRTPAGFTFEAAKAEHGAACQAVAESADIVALTLTSTVSQNVPFTLSWK